MTLSGRQKRHLRALAHHLVPVVQLGKEGVSESIVSAVDRALTDHELIKVRLPQVEREERAQMAVALERSTGSASPGTSGRIVLLYRRHPSEPKITLPR
jgi:RNA-binding protein